MKKLLFLALAIAVFACGPAKKYSSAVHENEIISTRKYIGNFIDYCHTGPEISGGAHLIWIKTTLFNGFGKLSAYGKTCDFSVGDRLYLKRTSSTPGAYGNWTFQIENDSSVYYMVSGYRYVNNALVLASF
jgi:hypothetical protein